MQPDLPATSGGLILAGAGLIGSGGCCLIVRSRDSHAVERRTCAIFCIVCLVGPLRALLGVPLGRG